MNKRRTIIAVVCILAVVLLGLFAAMSICLLSWDTSIYMFADISECEAFESLNAEGGHFTKYQDARQDAKLDNLQYTDFFAGKYTCERYTFEIFAYVFADSASARAYFENATGKNSYTLDENFSMSSGLTASRIIVFKGNMAYAVYCPLSDLADVSDVLADLFTIKMQ